MRTRSLVLVVLVLLAGCGGQSATAPTTDASPTSAVSTSPAATTAPPEPTTSGPQNPWTSETATVAVDTGQYSASKYVAAVRQTIEYWNSHRDASPFDVSLRLDEDAEAPDILVEYDSRVQVCDDDVSSSTYYYCTDTYAVGDTETGTSTVKVAGGYTANSTKLLTREAFADLLAVASHDEPADYRVVEDPVNQDPWPYPGDVVVAVNQSLTDRNMTPLVEQAVEYWAGVDNSSKNYTTDFEVDADARTPDLVVEFQTDVTCANETDEIVGCAPRLGQQDRLYGTETIEIETGYTNESTLETIKHEFGHVYGRQHGQSPMPLMNESGDVDRLPVPNATEVDYPWRSTNISVAVEGDLAGRERDQVSAALGYFEAGADGMLPDETPTFTRTGNTTEADITIEISDDEHACGDDMDGGSCGNVYGYNTDADNALEYYSEAAITLADIEDDRVAWHVGYWLAYSFGATDGEYPDPLDNENDDRDSDWWE